MERLTKYILGRRRRRELARITPSNLRQPVPSPPSNMPILVTDKSDKSNDEDQDRLGQLKEEDVDIGKVQEQRKKAYDAQLKQRSKENSLQPGTKPEVPEGFSEVIWDDKRCCWMTYLEPQWKVWDRKAGMWVDVEAFDTREPSNYRCKAMTLILGGGSCARWIQALWDKTRDLESNSTILPLFIKARLEGLRARW
jgi:hypothetical protein